MAYKGLLAWAVLLASTLACLRAQAGPVPVGNRRKFTLLYIGDIHANLEPHPEIFLRNGEAEYAVAGGYARLHKALTALRKQVPDGSSLTIDGGDILQGGAAVQLSQGEAVVAPHNALGVDAAILGNWEVVYGPQQLQALAAKFNFPYLAANVINGTTGALVFKESIIVERAGVKIGIVGYTDEQVPLRQPPAFSRGLNYTGNSTVQPAVDRVRAAGAEFVIVGTHFGLSRALWLAENLTGVDLVLSADTHERTYQPLYTSKGVPVVEEGSFGSFVVRVGVTYYKDRSQAPKFDIRLIELRADCIGETRSVQQLVRKSVQPYLKTTEEKLGNAGGVLERYSVLENTADNVITDALRNFTGAELAFSQGYRFGYPLVQGPITYKDWYQLLPLDYPIKTGYVNGSWLLGYWEREFENVISVEPTNLFGGWVVRLSGGVVNFNASAPRGRRLLNFTIGGAPVDPERWYLVAGIQRDGDPATSVFPRLAPVRNATVYNTTILQATAAFVRNSGSIKVPSLDRINPVDLPRNQPYYSQFFLRRALWNQFPAYAQYPNKGQEGCYDFSARL